MYQVSLTVFCFRNEMIRQQFFESNRYGSFIDNKKLLNWIVFTCYIDYR